MCVRSRAKATRRKHDHIMITIIDVISIVLQSRYRCTNGINS